VSATDCGHSLTGMLVDRRKVCSLDGRVGRSSFCHRSTLRHYCLVATATKKCRWSKLSCFCYAGDLNFDFGASSI